MEPNLTSNQKGALQLPVRLMLFLALTLISISSYAQQPCRAGFTHYTMGNTAHFYDSSAGNNLIYFWNFGDGDSSTSMHPSHNYNSSGQYRVCLTVKDTVNNCSDTFCNTVIVSTAP